MEIFVDFESGTRFGRLLLTGKSYLNEKKKRYVEVTCDCGVTKWVRFDGIKNGSVVSCGCANKDWMRIGKPAKTHGLTNHPIYVTFCGMKARCYNENSTAYEYYGGKKIGICNSWLADFKNFYDWSMANGWQPGYSIERNENDKWYQPDNCKWIPLEDQPKNKTSNVKVFAFGETKYIAEWVRDERCVVQRYDISRRLKAGWDPEKALTTPSRIKKEGYRFCP